MKTALEYTVDDLKDIIVRAWESGVCRGRPPAPYVIDQMECVYRESIKHDKPWGPEKGTICENTRSKLLNIMDDLDRLVDRFDDTIKEIPRAPNE